MKSVHIFAILVLAGCVFFCGCVQINIYPPGGPGGVTLLTTVTPPVSTPATAETTSVPVAPTNPAETVSAPAGTQSPQYIGPIGDLSRVGHREFTFNYGSGSGSVITIRVPVNMSVLYGARETTVKLPSSSWDPAEIQAYIQSFESDPSMEELYADVLTQLRSARFRDNKYLSDDEYLELIVAFVQQIPYSSNPSPKRKYPVEVIYDKTGDSDEKSLLLANLLAREGYDVSLMVFEDRYETTGIRIVHEVPDSSLKVFSDGKKDYAFIDAYQPRFIGSVPVDFTSSDDPAIYPVGNGTKSYGPINYVWKIVADLNHMGELRRLTPDMSGTVIRPWDKVGTCRWIKNSKLLETSRCYCCEM